MAIPFALPEDEINNLMVAVIFILSQTRLQRTSRNRELQECMEELVRLLVEELDRRSRTSEYDNQLRQTLLLLCRTLNEFTPRISPTSNYESCCDDAKLSLREECATEEDCSQVGLILRKTIDDDDDPTAIFKEGLEERKDEFVGREETLLSRLVPGVRRTFWTAVPLICMVGWHLFQTNYCM